MKSCSYHLECSSLRLPNLGYICLWGWVLFAISACQQNDPKDEVKEVVQDIISIQQAGLEYVRHLKGIPDTIYKLSGTGYLDTKQLSYAWGDYLIYQEQDQMYIGVQITDVAQFEVLKRYLPRVYSVDSANLIITPLFTLPLEDLLANMGSNQDTQDSPQQDSRNNTNVLGGRSNLSGLL